MWHKRQNNNKTRLGISCKSGKFCAVSYFAPASCAIISAAPHSPSNQKALSLPEVREKSITPASVRELFEKIYDKTKIESALNSLEKMQKLARVHKIGDYALQYLYAHNCTLGEVSAHLEALSVNAEDSENEGGLVAKGTDLDAIQMEQEFLSLPFPGLPSS